MGASGHSNEDDRLDAQLVDSDGDEDLADGGPAAAANAEVTQF